MNAEKKAQKTFTVKSIDSKELSPYFSNSCPTLTKRIETKTKIIETVFFCTIKRVMKMFIYFSSLNQGMNIERTYNAIKSLKIQGAEAVSTAGILAIEYLIKKSKAKSKHRLRFEVEKAKTKLVEARDTEPQLENYLNYIITKLIETQEDDLQKIKKELLKEIKEVLKYKQAALREIIENGRKVIKSGMIVYIHCRSSTVTSILKEAKKKKKKFIVHNTETRPKYQGRKTAKELAKAKIPVVHFVDSGARIALKNADIMLIGADAITHNRVYNKIGSEMIALVAKNLHVPVYVCASLWKFNPHKETIEERPTSEVWEKPPKGVKISNFAFEKISFKYIKGIICEDGILKPKAYVRKARLVLK